MKYVLGFLITYIAYVISLSLKKGYTDFNGIPLVVYITLFFVLVAVGIVLMIRERAKKNNKDQ